MEETSNLELIQKNQPSDSTDKNPDSFNAKYNLLGPNNQSKQNSKNIETEEEDLLGLNKTCLESFTHYHCQKIINKGSKEPFKFSNLLKSQKKHQFQEPYENFNTYFKTKAKNRLNFFTILKYTPLNIFLVMFYSFMSRATPFAISYTITKLIELFNNTEFDLFLALFYVFLAIFLMLFKVKFFMEYVRLYNEMFIHYNNVFRVGSIF